MARVDRAKPYERASQGSRTSTTTTAPARTGGPAERRDRLRPSSPMAPIAAARTTLGSGRASTTKPASASPASTGRSRRGSPRTAPSPRTIPTTTATFEPLTAVRCVIPVARIAAVRSSGVRLVSPMTRPGSRPRASAGASSTAARRPARSRSAPAATAPGGATTWGMPATASTATRSSPGSAGPSRPRSSTVARHGGSTQLGATHEQHRGAGVGHAPPASSRTRVGLTHHPLLVHRTAADLHRVAGEDGRRRAPTPARPRGSRRRPGRARGAGRPRRPAAAPRRRR